MNPIYLNIKQSIWILLLWLFISYVFAVIFVVTLDLTTEKEIADSWLELWSGILEILATALVLFLARKNINYHILRVFRRFNPLFLFPLLMLITGLSVILSEVDNLFRVLLPIPKFLVDDALDFYGIKGLTGYRIFSIGIAAPLAEEFLFRGVILQNYLKKYTKITAIIVSSLFFGLAHINPWQFIYTFFLGILLALFFVKCKSLIPCMIAHSFYNLLFHLPKILFHKDIPGYNDKDLIGRNFQHQPLWFDLLGVSLLIIGFYMYFFLFKEERR